MSAAARKQKSRQKLKDDPVQWAIHLEKERERDKARREKKKLEMNKLQLQKKRKEDTERQRRSRSNRRQLISDNTSDDVNIAESPIGTYRTSQSFGKAMARSRKVLPKSPRKKKIIVRRLAMEIIPEIKSSLNIKKTEQNNLSNIEEKVIQFYNSDEISRQAPGKRDMKSVKEASSGKRVLVPKRHMLMTVGEAFAQFKRENKSILIEKSKFYSLRPQHVMLVTETPHNVCVCKYHANFDFLLRSISNTVQEFPSTSSHLLSIMCCNVQNEKCMTGICDDCHKETNKFVNEDDYRDKYLVYKQWKEENGFLKVVEINSSVMEAINELNNQLPFYKLHCFVKTTQSSYFEESKNNVGDTEAVIQVDFAENYSAISQDEIQSAHWTHPQITVFTCCAWLKGVIRSFVVISDELQHDKYAVWAFLNAITSSLKKDFSHLKTVKIFSDGCSAQFKNKYNISNLCYFLNDFKLTCEWNFLATSHGKGAVDGIGGLIKSRVWVLVKSRKAIVNSALDFFKCAQEISEIKALYVSAQKILVTKQMLTERWEGIKSIEGIKSYHHFKVSGDGINLLIGKTAKSTLRKVAVISSDCLDTADLESLPRKVLKLSDLNIGDYVVVSLASSKKRNSLYYANVLDINFCKEEISLKYMQASGPHWIWPEKDDISIENFSVIVKKVAPPSLITSRGHYKF